jgi:hypothetical protein
MLIADGLSEEQKTSIVSAYNAKLMIKQLKNDKPGFYKNILAFANVIARAEDELTASTEPLTPDQALDVEARLRYQERVNKAEVLSSGLIAGVSGLAAFFVKNAALRAAAPG